MNKFLALSLLVGLFVERNVQAYATFIGYGYTSCQVCHFNAFGNGPLTDYGRALGASVISAKGPWNSQKSDEELAQAAKFLNIQSMPAQVKPAMNFRALALYSGLEQDKVKKRYIPMQADASLTLTTKEQKHWLSATLGYLPKRSAAGKTTPAKVPFISREHYASVRITKNNRLFVGMMDIPFGIRTPDHTAFSRTGTFLAQNDQSHSFVLHTYGEKYEIGLAALAGNLLQDSKLRQVGGSAIFEYDFAEKFRFGHSHLFTQNKYRSRLMNAIHTRVGAGEGSATLFEAGTVKQVTKIPSDTTRLYFHMENMIRLTRGLHFIINGEYTTADTLESTPKQLTLGPALQYFPFNGSEIRLDFKTKRALDRDVVERDSTDFMGQWHLWF